MAKDGVVVLVELCAAIAVLPSASSAGAAAKPVVGLAVVMAVVMAELVVVATWVVPTELDVVVSRVTLCPPVIAAAAFGMAVHRRPRMVVKKAPDGRPLDAIFEFEPLPLKLFWRVHSLQSKRPW
jgi:hypothetical protein